MLTRPGPIRGRLSVLSNPFQYLWRRMPLADADRRAPLTSLDTRFRVELHVRCGPAPIKRLQAFQRPQPSRRRTQRTLAVPVEFYGSAFSLANLDFRRRWYRQAHNHLNSTDFMNPFTHARDLLRAHDALCDTIRVQETIRDGMLTSHIVLALQAARATREFAGLPIELQESVLTVQVLRSPREALELLLTLIDGGWGGARNVTRVDRPNTPAMSLKVLPEFPTFNCIRSSKKRTHIMHHRCKQPSFEGASTHGLARIST